MNKSKSPMTVARCMPLSQTSRQLKMGPQFTGQQRSFMVTTYIRTRSPRETQDLFRRQFPGVEPPNLSTIRRNYLKYTRFATSLNRNAGNSGRRRTARSQRNIEAVRQELVHHPTSSIRRNNVPQVSRSSFQRIVKLDLNWHPYKIVLRHQLRPGDFQRRMDFSEWILNRPQRFLGELIIGDEATFRVDGKVCTQNV